MKRKQVKQAGALLAIVGAALVLHDIVDVPHIDRFHHWQLGAGLVVVGLLA